VPLVGRDGDADRLREALLEARLVTLTGPAGVGKTRLADERCDAIADGLQARALVVRLEHADGAAALIDAVESAAQAMDDSYVGERLPSILASLGPLLLVLDPIDRALVDPAAAAAIAGWLEACPELSILSVGRTRSGLPGERVVELGVLDESDALTLLQHHGALHRSGFALRTSDEREAARAIVESLDRLPLAIELASSRLAVMTPQALLHRLKNRWDVLKKGGATDRHATLEAAISWSLELLDPSARALLEDATIFRGGFSVEMAEAVITGRGAVLDGLLHLRERSLLGIEELAGEVRLTLLTSVRLVVERGLDPTRTQRLEEAHAQAYVRAAETWANAVELHGDPDARAALMIEHDNLAIVVERILNRGTVSTRAADRALRILSALGSVSSREGAGALLRSYLETAIQVAQGSGADPRLLARALSLRGTLRASSGRVADGERDLAEALVLASHSGERAIEARVLLASAHVAASEGRQRQGQRSQARSLLKRAQEIAERSEDHVLRPRIVLALAMLDLGEGALGAARLGLEDVHAQARRSADRALGAEAARGLGELLLHELSVGVGDAKTAMAHLDEAIATAEAVHDPLLGAEASRLRGLTAAMLGEDPAPYLEASLSLARRAAHDDAEGAASAMLGLTFHGRGASGEARALLKRAQLTHDRLEPELAAAALLALSRIEEAVGRADPSLLEQARARPVRDPQLAAQLGTTAVTGAYLAVGSLSAPAAASPSLASARPRQALLLDADASYFSIDGAPLIDLSRRRPLRRLLAHLAAHADQSVAWDALLEVGWPGEKMRADAGAHRVRVAISTLRKMGLSGIVLTDEDGYRVRADVRILPAG
jgi:predicted ATPase